MATASQTAGGPLLNTFPGVTIAAGANPSWTFAGAIVTLGGGTAIVASGGNGWGTMVTGDTAMRCSILGNGTIQWGNGTGAADTFVGRSSADVFQVASQLKSNKGRTKAITVVTDTLTLDGSHHNVVCNKGTAMTVNLPAVASNTGREYIIKNKGAGVVTVDANGAELIDNAATQALNQWQSLHIVSDGTIWVIVN